MSRRFAIGFTGPGKGVISAILVISIWRNWHFFARKTEIWLKLTLLAIMPEMTLKLDKMALRYRILPKLGMG